MRRKCPYCAEKIQAKAVVCRYCGREIPQDDEYLDNSRMSERKQILIWTIVGIIALPIIIFAILSYSSYTFSQKELYAQKMKSYLPSIEDFWTKSVGGLKTYLAEPFENHPEIRKSDVLLNLGSNSPYATVLKVDEIQPVVQDTNNYCMEILSKGLEIKSMVSGMNVPSQVSVAASKIEQCIDSEINWSRQCYTSLIEMKPLTARDETLCNDFNLSIQIIMDFIEFK